MKKTVLIFAILIALPLMAAQQVDDQRMNRDLEIAKNVLATLIKTETGSHWSGSSVEASYVEGYGVILTIPGNMLFIHGGPFRVMNLPRDVDVDLRVQEPHYIISERTEDIEKDVKELQKQAQKMEAESRKLEEKSKIIEEKAPLSENEINAIEHQVQEMAKQAREMEKQAQAFERQSKRYQIRTYSGQDTDTAEDIDWEHIMITFLADYADLIGQLKPTDKIMVNQEAASNDILFIRNVHDLDESSEENAQLSIEANKKDISAYKSGKMSLDELKGKMSIKKNTPVAKLPDIEIFTSIFRKYYSPDLSATFFTESNPRYEILDNFGVIMHVKMYSAYLDQGLFMMPALNRKQVDPKERNEAIETLYPKFKEDIREFVIDYGRTIRSLDENEMLLLKVEMTRCEDCNIPKSIDVAVKINTLRQFDQQKLSRDKALTAVEVKEYYE